MNTLSAISDRQTAVAADIPSSSLHESFREVDRVAKLPGAEVIRLHVGEPYFQPPTEVAQAVAEAVKAGRTAYTDVEGLLPLRQLLAEKLVTQNGHDTDAARIFVTPGSCQAISALLNAMCEPGAEILLPELHWPIHVQQALLARLRPVFYPLDSQGRPDLAGVRSVSSARTRYLLVNSPANPSGAVTDEGLQRALLGLAHEHGWQVISDEAYEDFVYVGAHTSMAALERDLPGADRLVHSVYTFSKNLAMTGYRLGYLATANAAAAAAVRVHQEATLIGPSTPIQYGGVAALGARSVVAANHALVRQNRDSALPALTAAGLLPSLPQGGWYAMLDITGTGPKAERFAAELLDRARVAVVPGSGFALRPQLNAVGNLVAMDTASFADGLVRIAFCVSPAALEAGVARLLEFVRDRSEG